MIIDSDKMHSSVTCNEMNVSYCAHAYIGLLDIAPSCRSKAPPPKKMVVETGSTYLKSNKYNPDSKSETYGWQNMNLPTTKIKIEDIILIYN